eukprot:TRINITY_DN1575_c0_g1_i1.p1 TRINITY_DN1575_c0_g1~~TRINITY_DN1575_c0_g1_i1.p1  ORF type:complete len:454 (-),score=76.00 TRINITY_DN1575_c0_g1_i1:17-1330(-)
MWLIITALILTLSYFLLKSSKLSKTWPGDFKLMHLFTRDNERYSDEMHHLDGSTGEGGFVFSLAFLDALMLTGDEGFKFIYSNKNVVPGWPGHWIKLLGDNSLTNMVGDEHKNLKRILMRSFTKEKVDLYFDMVLPVVYSDVQSWTQEGEMPVNTPSKNISLKMALVILFGLDESYIDTYLEEIFVYLVEYTKGFGCFIPLNLPFLDFGKGIKGRKDIIEFMNNNLIPVVKESSRESIAKVLLDTDLPEEDLCDHLLVLLWAGQDTTTAATNTMIYLLSQNPEIRERLEEAYATLSDHPTYDELKEVELAESFIKEIFRMYPPVPSTIKKTNSEIEYKDHRIAKGTYLMNSFFHNGDQEKEIDIDRYHKNPDTPDPLFYVFGGGTKKCLGYTVAMMEMRTVLFAIIKKNIQIASTTTAVRNPFPFNTWDVKIVANKQ